jgi:hypothetical protein
MRWTCPICGSRDYMRVVLSRGKQEYPSQFFTCLGCSVMFVEPMLFARAPEVRAMHPQQASEMAHVDSNERLTIVSTIALFEAPPITHFEVRSCSRSCTL